MVVGVVGVGGRLTVLRACEISENRREPLDDGAWAPWGRRQGWGWGWGRWAGSPQPPWAPSSLTTPPSPRGHRAPCRCQHPPLPFLPSAQQTPGSGPSFPAETTRRGSHWVSRASSEARRVEAFEGFPPSSPQLGVDAAPLPAAHVGTRESREHQCWRGPSLKAALPRLNPGTGGGATLGSRTFVRHTAPAPLPGEGPLPSLLPAVLGTQEVGEQAVLPEEASSGNARAPGSPDLMLDTSLGAGLQPAEQGGWGAGSRPAQPSAPVPPGAQPRASLRLHSRPGWPELQGPDFLEPAQHGALARASGRSGLGRLQPNCPPGQTPGLPEDASSQSLC